MKRQNVGFYLPKGTVNDATEYYCKLIEKSFSNEKYSVIKTDDYKDVKDKDIIVTIRPIDCLKIIRQTGKLIHWFQGIGPEEYILLHGNNPRSFIMYYVLCFIEKLVLKRSDLCIFVSDSMKKHYECKYKLDLSQKSVIIPCYNKHIDRFAFKNNMNKLDNLNFVYAGGLFAWQCIDKTLLIFKEIQNFNNSATLTLLTSDIKKAQELINKYQLKNVLVDYCELNKLQARLAHYKYAFLIRENHVVNNVSTPTKMNSYLAAGLIPIYTNVIDAFEANINLGDFAIKINPDNTNKIIANKILEHHNIKIDMDEFLEKCEKIFEKFYNDDIYIDRLMQTIDT
ncbi:hypothetical protein LAJ61_00340 [Moraxella osloensis]|nr:hypothetical protein [Moraxella osloensis]UAY37203.1 hypothetical protein LAJ61_00340 [Moraxella osloensis]